ncbi:hypothetical protein E1B28_013149 [Marasmius oreades]|uniref:Terpenoid synthase n=1 Tax=Marasmius oreades TaxID=181124 RepID=A0A9P7UPL0_9AGAR|nr:uncharacterized protein E1B28_013149 [Marasmius oreades]KAG7087169.1 hypothetical protein E1B28_013149 [Marasmius oreades]
MNDAQYKDKNSMSLPHPEKSFIKCTVQEVLQKCNLPFDRLPFDENFYNRCKEMLDSKYHLPSSIGPYLYVGASIASTAYSHLPEDNRVHVAIYTTLVSALDDNSHKRMEGFNHRFVKGLPQDDPILDALAKHLLDAHEYYGQIQCNLIVTSTLDFVTSLMMDIDMTNVACSPSFAAYCRSISGVQVAYTMFMFPKSIEFTSYIHCLPHISIYINYLNDVLSFYKEELRGEEENFASMLAKESLITKQEAIQRLADDVVEAERNISKGLAGNQSALDIWQSFKVGFVRFHTSCHRYKLQELFELPLTSWEIQKMG